jgi:hypothetical protein
VSIFSLGFLPRHRGIFPAPTALTLVCLWRAPIQSGVEASVHLPFASTMYMLLWLVGSFSVRLVRVRG